jgi:adenine/guanine phosphoribosyltransferase-like PRPP-binding protein
MRRFTPQEVDTIRVMAARGFSGIAIARELGRPALAIRKKAVELGVRLRPMLIPKKARVVVPSDVLTLLKDAAAVRGVNARRLASMILSTVACHGIINAVLDDLHT